MQPGRSQILIAHGATVDPEHAAGLGSLDRVREVAQKDSEALTRPRSLKAPISGATGRETPRRAAKRRNRTEVVSYLLQHGAVEDSPVLYR